jgi:hypothetical protein
MTKRRWFLPILFGVLSWKLPFVFRYDINYQTERGVHYLMSKHILKGEFPVYLCESDYVGTLPHFVVRVFLVVLDPLIALATFVSFLTYLQPQEDKNFNPAQVGGSARVLRNEASTGAEKCPSLAIGRQLCSTSCCL